MLTLKNFNLIPPVIHSDMQWPCPDWYHVPTKDEWVAVKTVWTTLWGWGSAWTNFGIALKLPFTGRRNYNDADVYDVGSDGRYWSSTPGDADNAYRFYFHSSYVSPQDRSYRSIGYSVRCFKDSPVVPTSSWTKLYWTSIEAGWIFWSSDLWLISMSSDWITWITIADKNLWATTVWNSWDTLSEANCGWYFQRWNNYMFPWPNSSETITKSATQVDATWYWPGNYYSSSTWITTNPRHDSTSDGKNLWWWVSQWTWTD